MEKETSFKDIDLTPEKIEDVKEEGEKCKFHCELCDKEMVNKIAFALLEGLSSACVDMTTGAMFKSPGTVAADIRKEFIDFIRERSESFVAESVILEGGIDEKKSDNPYDIISDFIDDFVGMKRNLLSRVSEMLLSDAREDKIDEFVQEMEMNSFWNLDRRETIAQNFLRNVDFKNEFHCNMKFHTGEQLQEHKANCGFRTVTCRNEGCNANFSAALREQHDSVCPFKLLACEQQCSEFLLRQEMDKHCITTCPMKLVNCPFYSIGCQVRVPSCRTKDHFSSDVGSHVVSALLYLHKGTSKEDVKSRAKAIEQESYDRLAGLQGARSFTAAVKDLDAKHGPLKIEKKQEDKGEEPKATESEPILQAQSSD